MGVLDGIRILDLTQDWAGAMATLLLADQGAELVRIESQGDPLRQHPGARVWLRGRRSVVLDLRAPHGRAIAHQLALGSDILIAQREPAALAEAGLAYETLAAEHPRLIYCLITPWGEEGPSAGDWGHDHLVAARTGIYDQVGWREGPTFVTPPMPSLGAALLAVQGLGAALFVRERTGRGQKVATSLFAGALAVAGSGMVNAQRTPSQAGFGVAARHPFGSQPFYRIYQCSDGRWLHFGCLTPRLIQNAIRALALQETMADPRFGDGRAVPTSEAREELIQIVAGLMKQRPYQEWADLFEREDVPYAPPQWTQEFMDDPQVRHLGLVVETEGPQVGPMEQMGQVLHFLAAPGRFPGPAPTVGQHTQEVLAELGSYAEKVGRHEQEGVFEEEGGESRPQEQDVPMEHPLAGVKILDMAQVIAGPYGPALLSDLGAEVIKVEPGGGDALAGLGGVSLALNRGKRGIAIDLQCPEGRAVLHRLAAWADVLVENYRPGVVQRLGVDYGALSAINPRLIYLSVTAFGSTGPYAHRPGVDPLLQAMTGVERSQGGPYNPPIFLRVAVCDYVAAMLNAAAITLALFHRERTGRGQQIETSLLQAGVFVNSEDFVRYPGRPPRRFPDAGQHGLSALDRMYPTAAGWLFLVADGEGSWARLVSTPGLESLAQAEGRAEQDAELAARLEEIFATDTAESWHERLEAHGVPSAPVVQGYSQLFFEDVQAILNGYLLKREHPQLGEVELPGRFLQFSATPAPYEGRGAPLLGQHTDEILAEFSYSPEEIAALHELRVVT